VQHFPLIARLRTLQRNDLNDLARTLENIITSEASMPALRAGIASTDRATRRECIRLAVARHKISLCLNALASPDATVRLCAARFVLAALPEDEACAVASELANDPFAAVRRAALQVTVERCPHERRPRVCSALLDRNISVRALAASCARTMFDIQAAEFYRAHIPGSSNSHTAASLVGLGECGGTEDVALLRHYHNHHSLRIRRSALQAIAALDAQGNADLFSVAVASPRAGLSRKAREILMKHPTLVDRALLEEALRSSEHLHVRNNARKVLEMTQNGSSAACSERYDETKRSSNC
jgi:HEAT repeat protein